MKFARAVLWFTSAVLSTVVAVGFSTLLMGATSPREGAVYNVRNCGAKGDGTTDDTLAIRKCYGYIATNGGGVLYFPGGTYIISRQASEQIILDLPNNTIARGDGPASIIQLPADFMDSVTDDWRMIGAVNDVYGGTPSSKSNITIEYLTINGTNDETTTCDTGRQQNHGIAFFGRNAVSGSEYVVHDVKINGVGGDGIYFGNLTSRVRAYNIVTENVCRASYVFAGANGSFDGSFDNVYDIPHPSSGSHRSFDTEVTLVSASSLRIQNSYFYNAELSAADYVYFGNNIINGQVDAPNLSVLHFVDNTVIIPTGSTNSGLYISATADEYHITGNTFFNQQPDFDIIKLANSGNSSYPRRSIIDNNILISEVSETDPSGPTLSAIRVIGHGAIITNNFMYAEDGYYFKRCIYIEGMLDGIISGNYCDVATEDALNLSGKSTTVNLGSSAPTGAVAAGATSFTVTAATGWIDGMNYQVWSAAPAYIETISVEGISGTTISLRTPTTVGWAGTATFKRVILDIDRVSVTENSFGADDKAIQLGDTSTGGGFTIRDFLRNTVIADNRILRGDTGYSDAGGNIALLNYDHAFSIPDDGAGTSPTSTTAPRFNAKHVFATCLDANNCLYTPADTYAEQGDNLTITNVSVALTITMTPAAGSLVQRGGALVLAAGESTSCVHTGTEYSCH